MTEYSSHDLKLIYQIVTYFLLNNKKSAQTILRYFMLFKIIRANFFGCGHS